VKLLGLGVGTRGGWLKIVLTLVGPGFGCIPPMRRSTRTRAREKRVRKTRRRGHQQKTKGEGPLAEVDAILKKMGRGRVKEDFVGCFGCRLRQHGLRSHRLA
tara:strand:+ start:568 stop:873 length:306 start_codon:yes stop_codon:yes gene_type:complete